MLVIFLVFTFVDLLTM